MKKGEHTPGPWHIKTYERHNAAIIADAAGDELATIDLACMPGAKADARLIAAAPDLLAACEWSLSMMAGGRPEEDIAHLRDAIKKARGTP